MLQNHASIVAGHSGCIINCDDLVKGSFTNQRSELSDYLVFDAQEQVKQSLQKVLVVNEGAGDAVALLGMFRLVNYLSRDHLLGRKRSVKLVLDAGTGTTAVGLGFAAFCLRLPWEVTAVMLADTVERYREQERRLFCDFMKQFGLFLEDNLNKLDSGLVNWVERRQPRKFGNVLEGEIEVCQDIAQQTGVLVDPVYTLAAWEKATQLAVVHDKCDADVVMLHTGGTLGMFGLAQRYKSYFRLPKDL